MLLENFQSHVRSRVRLAGDGQLTVILGPSDSGKTAVIRALRWLWFNDAPNDFVRIGAEFARVSLKLENGDLAIRERGKSYNRYVTVINGQRQTYEGFGISVPLEVRQAFGVWPVQFGQDVEIWPTLSEQLDAPFLGKSISAPAKARVLGKLAGTEEVDMAMRGAAADALKASQAAGQAEDEVRKLDAQIAGYGYLDALEQRVIDGERLLDQADAAVAKRDRLKMLQDQLTTISRGIAAAEQIATRLQNLPAVDVLLSMTSGNHERRQRLIRAQNRLNEVTASIKQTTQTLNDLAGAEAAVETVTQASTKAQRLEGLRRHQGTLGGIVILERSARQTVDRLVHLKSVSAAVVNAEQGAAKLAALNRMRETLKGLAATEKTARQTLARVAGSEQAAEKLAAVPDLMARRANLLNMKGNRDGLIAQACRMEASAILLGKAVTEAAEQYRQELIAAGHCPMCGSLVNPEQLKEVMCTWISPPA